MTHRFTGQELDPETGLYAFPARYYDPQTSRWLGADPAMLAYLPMLGENPGDLPGLGGVFDPMNLNAYHYVSNNPLKYVDPTGEFEIISDTSDALSPLKTYQSYRLVPLSGDLNAIQKDVGQLMNTTRAVSGFTDAGTGNSLFETAG
jgi:RHS repeat-associated protein